MAGVPYYILRNLWVRKLTTLRCPLPRRLPLVGREAARSRRRA